MDAPPPQSLLAGLIEPGSPGLLVLLLLQLSLLRALQRVAVLRSRHAHLLHVLVRSLPVVVVHRQVLLRRVLAHGLAERRRGDRRTIPVAVVFAIDRDVLDRVVDRVLHIADEHERGDLVRDEPARGHIHVLVRTGLGEGLAIVGQLGGAGGAGGLLAVSFNGSFYFPVYDNNGNVMKYVDESGDVVAEYVYDDFGRTISQSGGLVDSLTFGFSTKYLDRETGLVAYQLRCYLPPFRIWNNRDPAEEVGGENLYRACNNQLLSNVDVLGRNRYITQFDVLNYGGSGGTQLHVGVAVDRWKCQEGNWIKTGVTTFDFGLDSDQGWRNRVLAVAGKAKGAISQREGLHLQAPITLKSTPEQDIVMYNLIKKDIANPPFYNLIFHQCIFWSVGAVNYGM